MSFIDDIIGGAENLFGAFGDNAGLIGGLITTALTGLALNKVNKSVTAENETKTETITVSPASTSGTSATTSDSNGVRLQVAPDANQKIPVLYGSAFFGGIITDAALSGDSKSMYYVLTLCERTGTKISNGQASNFTFKNVYWNDNKVIFKADGFTASHTLDRDGNIDRNVEGIVKIYPFNGSSSSPVGVSGYGSSNGTPANSLVPGWGSDHTMNDLVFVVVEIDYNSERGLTGIPTLNFQIENSMRLPGDCLYDYMTNTRYGAGVPSGEIYVE
jgi:hypothetical protein